MSRDWIAVSFYTPEYSAEAYMFSNSAMSAKIGHVHLERVESRGSWLANTAYKSEFCKRMLVTYKKPIVWVDCDATFEQYPALFDTLDCDIAAHYRRRGDFVELLTGTLYLSYNDRVLQAVDKWVGLCGSVPMWEQKLLQTVLHNDDSIVFHELPASYVKIFDADDMGEESVIKHWQASRIHKRKIGVTL